MMRKRPVVLGVLVIGVGFWLVAASPLLLEALARWFPIDWGTASNIGQAYGVASALLSTCALIGVIATLSEQRKQTAHQDRQRELTMVQIERDLHHNLLQYVIDDPATFAPVIFGTKQLDRRAVKRRVYAQLWFNYAASRFTVGQMDEADLRAEFLRGIFAGEYGRTYWRDTRMGWKRETPEFARIVDEELERAMTSRRPYKPRGFPRRRAG